MNVLVFGSINMDLTAYVPWLPKPGETLFGTQFLTVAGGKGANQAVAAARLGAQVRMVGRVGEDALGREHLLALKAEGVNVEGVAIDPSQKTGVAIIHVDAAGENTIVVISGANMALDGNDVARGVAALEGASVLLLQREVPLEASLAVAEEANRRGVVVIFDPAPGGPLPPELISLVDIITPNEVEVEPLAGFAVRDMDDAARAAEKLRTMGMRTAVIKLGRQGVYFESEFERGLIPPFQVEAVDSVAAGDAFNGGLAAALADGRPFREALTWGAAAGALAVTKEGAMPSLPKKTDLAELLRRERENL